MPEVALTFCCFADKTETVFAGNTYLVRDLLPRSFGYRLDMCDNPVDVLSCVRTVVIGLQKDDMGTGFAGEIRTNLCFVGLLFEHRNRHQQSVQRFDVHRRGDEHVRSALLAAFVEVVLNGAGFVLALNEPDIVVIVPDHLSVVVLAGR